MRIIDRRRTTTVVAFLLCSNAVHGFLSPSRRAAAQTRQFEHQQPLQDILQQVNALEESMNTSTNLIAVEEQVRVLEQQLTQLEQVPIGLTLDEFQQACWTVLQLPVEVRVALWYALSPDNDDLWECATCVQKIPTLVTRLYETRHERNADRLQQGLLLARQGKLIKSTTTTTTPQTTSTATKSTTTASSNNAFSLFNNNNNKKDNLTPEEIRTESMIQQLLPRVTRQNDRVATPEDLATVMDVLRRSSFVVSSSQSIPGGYCIRGTWNERRNNSTSSSSSSITERLKQLDTQFPKSFDAQLCWMPDSFSYTAEEEVQPFGVTKDPVLLLTKQDFTPTVNPILSTLTSLSAVATSLVFAVGMYGGNELVTTRLTQDGVDWFNGKLLDLFVPLATVSLVHLLAQAAAAQFHKVQLSFPILLPFWPLPTMGILRRIHNSPASRTAMANVALAGPMMGLITSAALLVYGLQMTATAPAEVAAYFPSLPVRVLQLSTAGGAAVDFFGGFYTSQVSSAAIPLHPLAVAGYVSLLIEAVDLLPLGATSGGRLSLALLGRQGHSVVGGLTWLILLLASLSDANADVLVGAWIVNNVVQNDPEVPCRNEVDPVGVPQAVAALLLWFVAALILVPLV